MLWAGKVRTVSRPTHAQRGQGDVPNVVVQADAARAQPLARALGSACGVVQEHQFLAADEYTHTRTPCVTDEKTRAPATAPAATTAPATAAPRHTHQKTRDFTLKDGCGRCPPGPATAEWPPTAGDDAEDENMNVRSTRDRSGLEVPSPTNSTQSAWRMQVFVHMVGPASASNTRNRCASSCVEIHAATLERSNSDPRRAVVPAPMLLSTRLDVRCSTGPSTFRACTSLDAKAPSGGGLAPAGTSARVTRLDDGARDRRNSLP